MKVIMYHYVQKFRKSLPRLNFLHIDNFRKQLDYFENNFGFIEYSEFENILKNKTLSSNGVVLTFDDGLKCHYTEVYKELKERGLWGIFYVNSQPILEGSLLDVHKTHILLACVDPNILIKDLHHTLLTQEFENTDLYDRVTYIRQTNDEDSLAFKRTLNYYLNTNERKDVLDALMSINDLNSIFQAKEYYLSKAEIEEMSNNGMIFGGHTHSHPLLSKLTKATQYREIKSSIDLVQAKNTFCFPYGGEISFNKDTLDILKKLEIKYCFSVENKDISNEHLRNKILSLPRYDCNFFPYGKIFKN